MPMPIPLPMPSTAAIHGDIAPTLKPAAKSASGEYPLKKKYVNTPVAITVRPADTHVLILSSLCGLFEIFLNTRNMMPITHAINPIATNIIGNSIKLVTILPETTSAPSR